MSETVNTQLSGTAASVFGRQDCTVPVIQVLLLIILIVLMCCLLSSVLAANQPVDSIAYQHPHRKNCDCTKCQQSDVSHDTNCNCSECKQIEQFSNDTMFSTKPQISSRYAKAEMIGEDENLQFGETNRYIYTNKNGTPEIRYDIYANLYILNGNVFDQSDSKQAYSVMLKNPEGKTFKLGNLHRDGDGMYKLKVISGDVNVLVGYNKVEITYTLGKDARTVISGHFK